MNWKIRGFTAVLLIASVTCLTALPQVAVLDAVIEEDMDPGVSIAVADKISESLVNSGKYTVLDRANAELVLREKEFQLSGLVRTEEIRRAGEYLGADLVVAARAARIGDTYFVSARMIDVKTGAITAQASVEREGRIAILLGIAGAVGDKLAGGVVEAVENRRFEGPVRRTPAPPPVPPPMPPAPAPRPAPAPAPAPVQRANVVIGIKGGVGMADVYGDDTYATDAYEGTRYVGGFYMSSRMDSIGFELDVLWAQKGYDIDFYDDVLLDNVYNSWVFNYVDIPFLVKLYPSATSPLYVGLGLYIGVYMSGTVTIEYETKTSYNSEANIEDVRELATMDFGGLLNLGLDFPVANKGQLALEARLGMGFNTWRTDGAYTPKHLVLSVMAGFGIAP